MNSVLEAAGGYVVLTGYAEAEDDGFNAYCPELGVATCGDTVEEVLDGLQDALAVYLEGLAEIGELERVFAAKGIDVQGGPPAADKTAVAAAGIAGRVYVLPMPAPVAV